MGDDELAELRRRKMAELQDQARREEHHAAQRAEIDAQKAAVLRAILEPEARERLARVRMTRPDVAESLENQIIILAQQGRIRGKIDDATLRDFLARVSPKSKDIKIERR
ncbi:MAG TPA: DNA-binding protein [Candidatus Thermoplasmatota archaeon]|nr:DNA-binding protein [Candidatus Thermoplasmatota archaeon]